MQYTATQTPSEHILTKREYFDPRTYVLLRVSISVWSWVSAWHRKIMAVDKRESYFFCRYLNCNTRWMFRMWSGCMKLLLCSYIHFLLMINSSVYRVLKLLRSMSAMVKTALTHTYERSFVKKSCIHAALHLHIYTFILFILELRLYI